MFEDKVVEVAIGHVRGLVNPTEAEREAAFELFVELASRTTTTELRPEEGLIREALNSLYLIFGLTREILRGHGGDVAKGRGDGNVTLATISLRVLNEIVRPRTSKWHPLLLSWEQQGEVNGQGKDRAAWEESWDLAEECRADLNTLRGEIRAYMDSLAKIAGAASLTDLVVPLPPSAPIQTVVSAKPHPAPQGAAPRTKMVRWFDPIDGVRSLLAKRKGDPKRVGRGPAGDNAMAPIDVPTADDGSLWIDYVSDLGDAFDPTAAVAWQLTRQHIVLPVDDSGELPAPPAKLPQGSILVMGGDEVYPYATSEGYRQQLDLPYRLAAACDVGEPEAGQSEQPSLVAIPGNHDWYGGIELFENVVVRPDMFAGHWRTPQTERWWVVELSHGWWLWGIDTALDNTLDDAQQSYFSEAAKRLQPGDRVILCSPVPLWQLRQKSEEHYRDLRQIFDRLMITSGASIPLFLAGDSHFFAHYRRIDGPIEEDHITAGGGGAFMQPTHNLPEQVPLEHGSPDFKLTQRWPRPVDSRALATKVGGIRDRQYWLIFVIMALVHAAYAALVSIRAGALLSVSTPADSAEEALRWVLGAWPGWPLLLLFYVAMAAAAAPNSRESELKSGAEKYGRIHGLAHVALLVAVATVGRWVGPDDRWWRFLVVPIGGVLTVFLIVAMIRWINSHIRASDTIAFSSSFLTRYKNFLRMHIDAEGTLSVYAVGLDPVGTDWFDALTKEGKSIPPFDTDGTPRLHYIWGKRFPSTAAHEAGRAGTHQT